MTITRRACLGLAGAFAAPALLRAQAQLQPVTLKLHHALPPISNVHVRLLMPWAKKVQAAADNRIRIELFGAMQLGGTPVQLYDQARDGAADIVWTAPSATPGRFPAIEVFELPSVAATRAMPNAQAVQEFAEAHAKEFDEVRLLGAGAHDHGLLHTARPIRRMEDLKGLRLYAPTRLAGEALHALGAAARAVPMAQLPEALSQKA